MTNSHDHESVPCAGCRRRRRRRIGLVALLLLVALPFTWSVVRCSRGLQQRNAITAFSTIEGCKVVYDGESYDEPPVTRDNSNLGETTSTIGAALAAWTEQILGVDAVHRCGTALFPADKVDEVLPHLKQFPYLRRVVVQEAHGGEKGGQGQQAVACRRTQQELAIESVCFTYTFAIASDEQP